MSTKITDTRYIGNSNRNKVFKGMGIQTVITVVLGLLGILYFSVMSRLLTEEDFGYFAIVMAITTILKSLTEAGLGASVIQNKNANLEYISTAFSLSLCLGVFFSVFLVSTANLFSNLMIKSDALVNGYRIMSISLVLYSINSVGRATIVKKLNFLRYGLYDIGAYILSCSVGIYMAYKGYGFYSTIVAMVLHQAFIAGFMFLLNHVPFHIRIYKEYVNSIVSYGGWLTGSVIVRNLTHEVDKLITTQWIPVAALGAYNRPNGFISQITGQLNNIFDTILFPILSDINDNPSKIKSSYEKATNLILLYSIVLAALFILGSDILIVIFLGSKWLYLNNIFQTFSLSIIFLCYGRLADCFFRSLGIVKSYFYTRCCVFICTVICIYLGCQYGILGLSIGLVFSRAADSILKVFFLKPHIPKDSGFYYLLIKTLFVPILLLIICYLIKNNIPYGTFISVLLYASTIGIVSFFFPKIFGQIYYDNIYLVIKRKLNLK